MMDNPERYTLSYRASETRPVLQWIKAAQCGSIIGLRGSGKSNFIRFLLRSETREHYLGPPHTNYSFVLINLLSLSERSEWAVYEMIVNNLLTQLHRSEISDKMLAQLTLVHQGLLRERDALTAERAVERCISLLCQPTTRRLVLLFDEFDAVFRDLPASLFRCLRAIRDSYKDQISYIVVGTHDLASLRTDLVEEVDHFYRLVSRNACWLGAYSEADARQMAGHLAFKHDLTLNETDLTTLLELSAGHAGLLKSILSLVWNDGEIGRLAQFTAPDLIKEDTIRRECQKIWSSLSEREKSALCAFSNKEPVSQATLTHLLKRGLMHQNGGKPQGIFSPLFAEYVKEQAPPPQTGNFIDRTSKIIQIDGRRIENLTELEEELLYYLYDHLGRVCTKDDLIEHVYRQRNDGSSDEMLQTLLSRLRKKIEPEPERPRYILTVRSQGYKFVLAEGK